MGFNSAFKGLILLRTFGIQYYVTMTYSGQDML